MSTTEDQQESGQLLGEPFIIEPDDSSADPFSSGDTIVYASDSDSYATSLSSSVLDYNWRHGRRFHAYKEGSYQFPNDEREQDRLDTIHHMFKLALDGELFLAPIPTDQPLRILDIGTGTGIWAIEVADQIPSAKLVLGNDLSPIQPTAVPPNVIFEVDDVESEWPNRKPFDFIHSRYMCGSVQNWPKLFQQAYRHTKPGGWIEFQDFHLVNYSQDGTLDEHNNVDRFYKLLRQACDKMNRRITKQVGALNMLQFLDGLEAFSVATFTSLLGWTMEDIQIFLADVRNDARKRGIHMMHNFHVVYAQKTG